MKNIFPIDNPIYLITDTAISGLSHIQIVKRAISAGVKMIQLRDKLMTKRELFKEAEVIRAMANKHKVTFIVNDYLDIAMAVKADGVHLGQDDMPYEEARRITGKKMIIGISTHNLKQAIRAEQQGADYIGFGPMFLTSTKDAGIPKGIRSLKNIRCRINIPIVAIGGISAQNISDVIQAGADACAVVSAVQSGDIRTNVKMLMKAI